MHGYITLKEAAEAQLVEKRSRFIGTASPVENEEHALRLIAEIRAGHRDANHNCYAYSLRGGARRYSDDGEPQGTAGIPILEVLKRENLENALVVVTRYFGGTLLGAGGLVRAYSACAKLAIDAADRLEMRPRTAFSLTLEYSMYDKAAAVLRRFGADIIKSGFEEQVTLDLEIYSQDFTELANELQELSGGTVTPRITGEVFGCG